MPLGGRGGARIAIALGVFFATAAGALWPAKAHEPRSGRPDTAPHVALVTEYCLNCHDEDKKKGELALDSLLPDEIAKHPEAWEKVVRKLRARQMPPLGEP